MVSGLVASPRAYKLADAVERMAARHAQVYADYVSALTALATDHTPETRAKAFRFERTTKRRWQALRRLIAALRDVGVTK